MATVTDGHTLGGSKQHKFVLLQFCRSDDLSLSLGPKQGVSRAVLSPQALGRIHLLAFPASRVHLHPVYFLAGGPFLPGNSILLQSSSCLLPSSDLPPPPSHGDAGERIWRQIIQDALPTSRSLTQSHLQNPFCHKGTVTGSGIGTWISPGGIMQPTPGVKRRKSQEEAVSSSARPGLQNISCLIQWGHGEAA